ncbi:MAG: hypothetical protein ABR987_07270 [Terracidiphilus sp.]
MKSKSPIVLAVLLPILFGWATNCQAKNNCPWINEATAGGLLGGEAVGEFTAASAGQAAVCTFTQTGANFMRTLRITVEVTPDTHVRLQAAEQACGKNAAPIQAIGNEASMCALDTRSSGLSELVVGRVRDQLFTITVSTTLKDDLILTRMSLKEKAYTASEQVAGNLF